MVTGYLQGLSLSVNRLIHISGLGDFQMLQIDTVDDPYPLDKNKSKKQSGSVEIDMKDDISVRVLEHADRNRQVGFSYDTRVFVRILLRSRGF